MMIVTDIDNDTTIQGLLDTVTDIGRQTKAIVDTTPGQHIVNRPNITPPDLSAPVGQQPG